MIGGERHRLSQAFKLKENQRKGDKTMTRTATKMTIKEQIAFLEAIDEALDWCEDKEKVYMNYDPETKTYSEPTDDWSVRKVNGFRKLRNFLEDYAM